MSAKSQHTPSKPIARALAKRGSQILLAQALYVGVAVLAAGTWRWPALWIYVGASMAVVLANMLFLLRRNPAVIEARSRIGEGTKRFDKIFAVLYSLAQLGMIAVSGLDAVRFGWSSLPSWLPWVALALLVLTDLPIAWAMAENPHLETTVRVQAEREHRVISTGPYAIVRHPMYVGLLFQHLAVPLVLGSAWALLVSAALSVMLVVRTHLEDRTLRAELPGYAEYAAATRHRLIPGIW